MLTLNTNKQKMYYANQDKVVPIYETYYDEEGNPYQLDTGETKIVYGEPKEFYGNIAMSGGEAEAVEFGVTTSDYEAVLLLSKGEKDIKGNVIELKETSLVWFETEPQKDAEENTDEYSADYSVLAVKPSINTVRYVLKKVVKQWQNEYSKPNYPSEELSN